VLDFALFGQPRGWDLYGRLVAAGIIANLLAYSVRLVAMPLGWSIAGGGQSLAMGPRGILSFILCGATAGLISAAIWFRLRVADDLRRN
jgi:hypothetical protein